MDDVATFAKHHSQTMQNLLAEADAQFNKGAGIDPEYLDKFSADMQQASETSAKVVGAAKAHYLAAVGKLLDLKRQAEENKQEQQRAAD